MLELPAEGLLSAEHKFEALPVELGRVVEHAVLGVAQGSHAGSVLALFVRVEVDQARLLVAVGLQQERFHGASHENHQGRLVLVNIGSHRLGLIGQQFGHLGFNLALHKLLGLFLRVVFVSLEDLRLSIVADGHDVGQVDGGERESLDHVGILVFIDSAELGQTLVLLHDTLPHLGEALAPLVAVRVHLDDPRLPALLHQRLVVLFRHFNRVRLDRSQSPGGLVVMFSLLLVAQHLVSLHDTLELLLAVSAVRVLVRVVLHRQLLVYLLDVIITGRRRQVQNLVEILEVRLVPVLTHHGELLLQDLHSSHERQQQHQKENHLKHLLVLTSRLFRAAGASLTTALFGLILLPLLLLLIFLLFFLVVDFLLLLSVLFTLQH